MYLSRSANSFLKDFTMANKKTIRNEMKMCSNPQNTFILEIEI